MPEKFNFIDRIKILRPVDKIFPVTSAFGSERKFGSAIDIHSGTDIGCPRGTPIKAVADGRVIRSGWENPANQSQGYGLRIMQAARINGQDFIVWYGHQSQLLVKDGDLIRAGQLIGKSGATGHATGPHLCLRLRKLNTDVFYGPSFIDENVA